MIAVTFGFIRRNGLIVTSPPVNTNIIKPTNFSLNYQWLSWAVEYGMQVSYYNGHNGTMALFICIVCIIASRSYKMN